MRALITGATGFLGKHLTVRLIDEGFKVFALGRNLERRSELEVAGAQFICADLLNLSDLKNLTIKVDIVFHCAGLSSPWGRREDFIANNVTATENLLAWSLHSSVNRFIYVSSSSVYFDYSDRLMISETDSIASTFANAYAESKYLGEQCCFDEEFRELEPVVIRPRGIIGEGDTSIMPRILQVAKNGSFPLIEDGQALVDVTYVGNVVEALFLAANSEGVGGQCFNISNDQPMSVRKLLDLAFEAVDYSVAYKNISYKLIDKIALALESWSKITTKKEPIITRYGAGLLAFSQTLDISKAKQSLGYEPLLGIEQGIKRYAQWQK